MSSFNLILALFVGLLGICWDPTLVLAQQGTDADAVEIGNLNEAYVTAFNAGDAAKLSGCFAGECEYTLLTGATVKGSQNVTLAHGSFFQNNPGAKIEGKQLSFRKIRPAVVLASGRWKVTGGPSEYPSSGIWFTVVSKRGDAWRYEAMRLMVPVAATKTD